MLYIPLSDPSKETAGRAEALLARGKLRFVLVDGVIMRGLCAAAVYAGLGLLWEKRFLPWYVVVCFVVCPILCGVAALMRWHFLLLNKRPRRIVRIATLITGFGILLAVWVYCRK
jgi:hypothetical protein